MTKIKVFVHKINADYAPNARAMTLTPQTYLSQLAKIALWFGLKNNAMNND